MHGDAGCEKKSTQAFKTIGEWNYERTRKFDAEELYSLCPSQGQHCICLCERYSLGAVFMYVSLAKPKTTEKELCLKKRWYFMCSSGLSSLLICPLPWKSLLWTQNWRDSNMSRYTEKSRCGLSWTLALLMHVSTHSSRSVLCCYVFKIFFSSKLVPIWSF